MSQQFREPTSEMPTWVRLRHDLRHLVLLGDYSAEEMLDVREAEALLEVLLDICPNAETLAHNWLLEVQKREHLKGWKP